jgi:hypothetical protein
MQTSGVFIVTEVTDDSDYVPFLPSFPRTPSPSNLVRVLPYPLGGMVANTERYSLNGRTQNLIQTHRVNGFGFCIIYPTTLQVSGRF